MPKQDVDPLVPRRQAAPQLGVSVPTLDRYERERKAPPSIKVGRRRYYRKSAIEAWLADRGLTKQDARRHRSYVIRSIAALG